VTLHGTTPPKADPASDEPTEIEIKLGVTEPRVVRALLAAADPARLAGFSAAGPAQLVRVTDRYLDTEVDDGLLARAVMRARLRSKRRTITLTVKRSGAEANGVTTRVELEAPATRSLRPDRWPASAARSALLAEIGDRPLRVIAELRQRRLVRLVRRGATTVELSLDALEAVVGGRIESRRHELEAELVEGDAQALGDLGEALRAADGVGPALGSKLNFALGRPSTR
jgi:inorganic triphosphatase YgiF